MIRVLVVDDSAMVRKVLAAELSRDAGIEVILAVDPYDARDKILRYEPDVVTLDIEMPRMDGLSFLARLMTHHPLPVIIVSSLTPANSEAAFRALELGAIDVIAKPSSPSAIPQVTSELLRAIRAAAAVSVSRLRQYREDSVPPAIAAESSSAFATGRMIVIGASTGGPVAIEQILESLPSRSPALLIVQHMPAGFTAAFARRLDSRCAIEVREAADGDAVLPGLALIAPGGRHLVLLRAGDGLRVGVRNGPPVHFQRPAVDVLFHSVAALAGSAAVAVQLTGMGEDGASGMLALREAGAHTIAQDEATSVVFSMPFEAIRRGGACEVLPLPRIAAAALKAAGRKAAPSVPVSRTAS
jgi:two-component system, chemotaxis family, protein-glutamate methylesterase/glutaminase